MKGRITSKSITCSTPNEEQWAMGRLCEFFNVKTLTARDLVSHVDAVMVENQHLRKGVVEPPSVHVEGEEPTLPTPMVAFLYQLMRDHVTMGVVEKIVCEQADAINLRHASGFELSNPFIEGYARHVEARLNAQHEQQATMREASDDTE